MARSHIQDGSDAACSSHSLSCVKQWLLHRRVVPSPLKAVAMLLSFNNPAPAWQATRTVVGGTARGRSTISMSEGVSVKKVAVIGAGLGGLALAKALETLDTGVQDITVFERRDELRPALGGGVQLSGGAAVLAQLGLLEELKKIANPLQGVLSRTVGGDTLLRLDIPEAIRRRADARERLTNDDDTLAYAVMRDALQLLLKDSLQKSELKLDKELVRITTGTDGKSTISFADGSQASGFDLVVAADGIGANSLKAVAGAGQTIYSGKRIQFGVVSESERPVNERGEFHQWFAQGVYALAGSYGGQGGSRSDMIALVFRGDGVSENADWDTNNVKDDCLRRLDEAGMPEEMKQLAQAADRFFELGVYFHLPRLSWRVGGGNVVLMGDAAHAMPPFLGQGANQAIQDALSIATAMKNVNEGKETLDNALGAYESIRKPPTVELLAKSAFLGELETLPGELSRFRNAFFTVTGTLGVAERVFVDGALPRT